MQLLAFFIPTFHQGYQRPGQMTSKSSTGQRCFPSLSELAAALCRVNEPGRNVAVYANIWGCSRIPLREAPSPLSYDSNNETKAAVVHQQE